MGFFSRIFMSERMRKANLAADQIYGALITGAKLEIPAALHLDDLVTQTLIVLRKRYPDALVSMLQSRSIVLTRGNASKAAMGSQAWHILDAHGYFPAAQLPIEMMIGSHEAFMRRNDMDPAQVDRENEERRVKETSLGAIVSGS